MNLHILTFLIFCMFELSANAFATGVYMEPEDFITQAFNNNPPKPDKLWIRKKLTEDIKKILGHDLDVIRIRYWNDGIKTAWILEEIGRDKPITVGLVVKQQKIEHVKVLVFRETRGWEIKYPFFTDQFKHAGLNADKELDRHIDGISGATLSVNALTKIARLALYLDSQITNKE